MTPTRQTFNRLRTAAGDNVAAVDRLNILERQTRELRTAEGERRAQLIALMGRTTDELASISNRSGDVR